ncbi:MAG TPA: IPT/TIG domain-containing protein [Planctomycetota bacterium]
MLALARQSAFVLLGALLLIPTIQAQGAEEDNCVHLVGYGGPGQAPAPLRRSSGRTRVVGSAGGGGTLDAGVCAVDSARGNKATPIKTSADFVPVTGDDALGFYCVYGVRASSTGGIAGNVGIFLFELSGGEILLYGSGYGNIAGANLFDAAYDMGRVDQVLRFCMGKSPGANPIRILVPHGHGDHVNPACNRELERLGWRISEIAFHQADSSLVGAMTWTSADRALFRVIPAATTCLQELTSYASPLGKLWVFERPGHTAGSIDLVIDVKNDPTNRFVVRGSQPSSPCAALPGQREIVNAHGNVELLSKGPTLTDIAPLTGSSLGGTPLTVTGADFLATGAGTPQVLLNGTLATGVVVVNDTTLTCLTPPGPPGQLVEVAVVTNNGKALYPGTFFYNALPTLTSLTPDNGNWRGGTIIQVRGSGFLVPGGTTEVFFGGKRASAHSVKSDTLLTCRTPAGTAATVVPVTVRTPNGEATLANAYRYNSDLSITAAEPSHATALGGTTIVLTGTSFTGNGTPPTVRLAGDPATSVTLLSDTSLSFVTPAGIPATSGDIVVTNSSGTATWPGFRYHATPAITGLTPPRGRPAGGTTVLLTGSGFQVDAPGTNVVRFGGILATSLSVLGDGSLSCIAPAGPLGAVVNVTVSNENGTGTLPLAFTYAQPLELVAVQPASGSADGGTLVTLTGVGFLDGPAGDNLVSFGGLAASEVNVLDDSTLTCRAPAGTPGAVVDVAIQNANGTNSRPGAYRYHARPTLTALAPDHGHAGASTAVTLTGTGFLNDQAGFALIVVGGVAATDVDVVSDTRITCRFPPGPPGARVEVLLANENGTVSLPAAFRYHTAPTLSSLAPVSGPAAAQRTITLNGSGFLDDQAGVPIVLFGGKAATAVSVLSDQQVRCNAPAGTPGTRVDVSLTNARGAATLAQGYRYHALPAVTAVSPARGSAQGGTRVTLSGSGFVVDAAGPSTVTFGGLAATSIVVVSDTSLTCTTPPGTLNAVVDVVVGNANGTGTLAGGFSYSVPPPTITALVPASGPAHAPGSVEVRGAGFVADGAGTNTLRFGSSSAALVSVIDDAKLGCQVPPGTPGARVDVVITNANGTGQLQQGFRYHARPAVTAIEPPSASALGGTSVRLRGSGFLVDAPGPNAVTFGGLAATDVVVESDTALVCVVPAGAPGTSVDVLVANANGSSTARTFAYHAAPGLLAVTPDFGAASGGTRVTITGAGFLRDAAGTPGITIGGRNALGVVVLDDTTLTCDTPRGDPGYAEVVLRNANGSATLANGFHFGRLPPQITSVEPASGPSKGQNLVTLRGRGFLDGSVGPNRVKFGELLATNVITLDDATVLCTPPASASGATVDVSINNRAGTATSAAAYRYHRVPTLTAVTPPEGQPLGTTRVTLTGTGFLVDGAGAPVVLFDAVRARDARVLDDTRIVCTAVGGGPGAVLDVTVRNANGSATLPDAYRVLGGPPGLRALVPATGPFVGGTRVEVEGSGFAAGVRRLTFGGVPATSLVVIDDGHLACTTPPGTLDTSVTVALETANGSAVLLDGFRYGPILPEIAGLAPDHGPPTGGTAVTITGSGFGAVGAGVTRVLFGGTPATQVAVVDDGHLTCRSPAGSPGSSVDVEVQNDLGGTRIKAGFRYHMAPELLTLTPTTGAAVGGTQVTLTGAGFRDDGAGTNQVRFGGVLATSVVAVSDEILTCVTPPGTPGATVDVRLTNANGTTTLLSAFRYLVRPELDSVEPGRGVLAGGTTLTLRGRGFQQDSPGPNQVTIGGVAALAVLTLDDATIQCTTPPGAARGPADVRVTNANGSTLLAGGFTYFVAPQLTAVAPARAPAAGGIPVTLTGLGFLDTPPGTNLVLFGGVAALDVLELSDTSLVCTLPAGTPGTTVDVTLANANGQATLARAFVYQGAPTLTGVAPDHGPAAGGTSVTLTGGGFLDGGAGPNSVTFGAAPATEIVVLDDATLTCRVPAGTAGASVAVTLSNASGSVTRPAAYRYHAEPTLTAVAPVRGPAAGGTTVTLTGSGFLVDQPGTPSVLFGGFGATNVVVVSDTSLTCTSPSGGPNTQVDVRVITANGSALRPGAFRYNALPQLTAVVPGSGSASGGRLVTLNGSGFGMNNPGPNSVLFGSAPATEVTVLSDASLTCIAPAGPVGTTVDVSVTNANGSATRTAAWRFDAPPILTTLAPTSGTALGGTLVTLTGTGFTDPNAGTTLVTFNGLAATGISVVGDTRIDCQTPPGLGGAQVEVRVSNAVGSAALPAAFRYHARPTLTAVLPARGSSSASSLLTLSGSGFLVDGAGPNTVAFGAVPATNVVVLGDGSLTCEVAPQPAGTIVDVALTNTNGGALLVAGFAFDAPAPTLASVAPGEGPSSGGTTVTLTGTGFQAFSAGTNAVAFGGTPATDVLVLGDTSLTCRTPPGLAGATVDVTLANVNGGALLPAAFTYRSPPPTLTSISAPSGKSAGGEVVTLTGSGFLASGAGPNTVRFGTTVAGDVSVTSDTQLSCKVPAGVPGASVAVELQNAHGLASLPGGYRYHGVPVLTSVTPDHGTSLGGTLLTLRGAGFLADAAGSNVVLVGGTPAASVNVLEDGRLTCRAPSGAPGAIVDVTLSNQNGAALLASAYRYHARPTLTSVTASSGPSTGGNRVTLTGTGFLADGAAVNIVAFGGITASGVSIVNDRTIQCNVPAGTSGTAVQVSVANVNGTALLADGYRYHARPTLTAVTPSSGPGAGGTSVTLTGSGFQADAPGTNAVTFGGVPATAVSVVSDTALTCLTPPGPEGTSVDVVVSNANGTGTLFGGFAYATPAAPAVVALAPSKGTTQGGTSVTVTGTAFLPGMTVTFGASAATDVNVLDSGTLTCVTPAAAGEEWADVTLAVDGRSSTFPLGFRYLDPPTLATVTPGVGLPQGGEMVVLTGTGFQAEAGAHQVRFGGRDASDVVVLDPEHLTAVVPDGTPLVTADVEVANEIGTAVLAGAFRWQHRMATDLDLDGRGDLVVGTPGDDTISSNAGAVHVFLGTALPLAPRTSATADFTAVPARGATSFGSPVVSGDLDGDGDMELLIGAPGDDRLAGDGGAVFVFDLPFAPSAVPLTLSDATQELVSLRPNDRLGRALVLHDLDRNGYPDLIAGAPGRVPGTVYVYLGGPTGLPSTASFVLNGEYGNEGFAGSLAAGDVDGDGWPEILVGAQNAFGDTAASPTGNPWNPGEVRIYRGGPTNLVSGALPWVVLSGREDRARFGATLAVGDFSGDGIADLAVGAPASSRAGLGSGAVFVFNGRAGLTSADTASADATFDAAAAGDALGEGLLAGDIDEDGRAELLIGAPRHAGMGRAYLLFGADPFLGRTMAAADAVLEAEGTTSEFGMTLALVDVDGNGLDDVVVTAPAFSGELGRVYVFDGTSVLAGRSAGTSDGALTGRATGDRLGQAVTGDH